MGADSQAYYRREIARLRDGCKLVVVGFGMLMGGVAMARYFPKTQRAARRAKTLPSFYEGVASHRRERQGKG